MFTEQLSVGQPPSWFGRRYEQDTLLLVGNNDVLSGVLLLFAGVGTLVDFAPFWALNRSFGTVDEDVFHLRKLLKQLLYGANLAFRELDLLAECFLEHRKIEMGCFTGTAGAFAGQTAEYIECWIGLDVKQDEKQFGPGIGQMAFDTATRFALTALTVETV